MTDGYHAIREDLEAAITRLAEQVPGRLGLVVRFFELDGEIQVNAGERFTAASIIKVLIMAEVYRQAHEGTLHLDEELVLSQADQTGGSGVLQYLHPGLRLTLRDAVELMISVSDNTATNMVVRRIGTEATNEFARRLGLADTVSAGFLGAAKPPEHRQRISHTSPRDMADLLTALARSELVDAAASQAMLAHMERVVHLDVLPRYLPITTQPERLGFPGMQVSIAHKSGSLTGIRHDVGIISLTSAGRSYRAIVSAFLDNLDDGDLWTPENVGERTLAELGRMIMHALARLALSEESALA